MVKHAAYLLFLFAIALGILLVLLFYAKRTIRLLSRKKQQIESQNKQAEFRNKQLELSISTQNKLFSIIAHDLRSPLASISNIGILLKIALDREDIQMLEELIDKLMERNNQVIQLTDNLLNWANSQTGKLKFFPVRSNLKSMLREAVSVFEENMAQKNIRLEIDVPDNIDVFADHATIKTVFRNLINNAVKYTHKGGKIIISQRVDNNDVIVGFLDNGIGIPENIRSLVFDITDEKQQIGTNGEKSTGLGLVVCKEFIERNNGRIWFESERGKGSTFYVSMPLYIEKPPLVAGSSSFRKVYS